MADSLILRFPIELEVAILSHLELVDLFHLSHTCRFLRQYFQPDKIISLVETLSEDAKSLNTLGVVSLSHVMGQIFARRAPYRFESLISRGASFRHIDHSRLLTETYVICGPGRRLQFMLRHGASLHSRSDGINGLLYETIRRHGPGRFREFLLDQSASLYVPDPRVIHALIRRNEWQLVVEILKRTSLEYILPRLEQLAFQSPTRGSKKLDDAAALAFWMHRDTRASCEIIPLRTKNREIDRLAATYQTLGVHDSGIPSFLTRTSNSTLDGILEAVLRRYGFGIDIRPILALGTSLHYLPRPSEPWSIQHYHRGIYAVFQGADPNWSGIRVPPGCTPLRMAAGDGLLEITRFLVEKGADMEIADDHGYTPATIAVRRGLVDVLRYLVEQGADTTRRNNDGQSPVEMAIARHETIVQMLGSS